MYRLYKQLPMVRMEETTQSEYIREIEMAVSIYFLCDPIFFLFYATGIEDSRMT